jgi:hypothetical protein
MNNFILSPNPNTEKGDHFNLLLVKILGQIEFWSQAYNYYYTDRLKNYSRYTFSQAIGTFSQKNNYALSNDN